MMMDESNIERDMKGAGDSAKSKVGEVIDKPGLQAEVDALKAEGATDDFIETVRKALAQAAERASTKTAKVRDRARDAYGNVSDLGQKVAGYVDPFVQNEPYVALGLAAATGLLLGLLIAGRGPKMVYIRPPN
jgi:ElaB/YqjD/DUF883 family membrane-anchored ribosome-binding protein